MSPVRSDDVGVSYANQLMLCVVLIICVTVSLGTYIVRLNARIDKARELSPVYLFECGKDGGAFIVYPDGRRRSSDRCHPTQEGGGEGVTRLVNESQEMPLTPTKVG
ncbi:hypothetical protein [Pseudomonas sp. ADAK18]|uniref:hypothetical protein n=1 Tax=Pseudomonas sp. ADAK18 TaxID=2730848 RepID=UPI001F48FB18|nr:hypothetical protein [Pseudomonas sp. ADAK18]